MDLLLEFYYKGVEKWASKMSMENSFTKDLKTNQKRKDKKLNQQTKVGVETMEYREKMAELFSRYFHSFYTK